jgi:hypothetical protein
MKHFLLVNMFRKFLIVVLCILSQQIAAVEVNNIYSAKVSVGSQSVKDRNQALKSALRIVMTKVAGGKITHPSINKAIKNYQQYVNQYQYERQSGNTLLNVSFNEEKVNNVFKENDLAIWGRFRPQIMLWLVQEQGFERNILSATSQSPLADFIESYSQLRGLPLVMPLMDLTDISALSVADVWGRFSFPIEQASTRYLAEAVVIIRISSSSLVEQLPEDNDCQSLCSTKAMVLDWSLLSDIEGNSSQRFGNKYQGDEPLQLLELALDDITKNIVQHYATSTANNNDYQIDVANIASLTSFIEVSDFLADLSAVESVQLVSANGNNRRFKLSLIGSQQTLLASLKLNKKLKRYIDPLAAKEDERDIPVFYWSKK